jgi:hypothetical protein
VDPPLSEEVEGLSRSLLENVRWRVYLYSLPAQVWAGFMLAMAITPDLGVLEDVQLFEQQASMLAASLERADQLKVSFGISAIYGIVLEALQPLVPYRDASGLDAIANVIGAAVGALVTVYLVGPWYMRRHRGGDPVQGNRSGGG